MMRLNRMTDYAIVLLAEMSRHPERVRTVPELARDTVVHTPTVSKVLTALTKAGVVQSHRGVTGGYTLARAADDINVAEIVTALEGPISLTACVDETDEQCSVESFCALSGHWNKVNAAIRIALEGVTLADMAEPIVPSAFLLPGEEVRDGA